ncbi:MAG: 4-(cytidine 5'-diphospho)-2-C-methyl-D-erythritol kinase [Hydrogenothermaceae bacterium]|nr:4-(cytidine 5'-diphospho)-2-C-methyl-D-erythritol kinase [Hydrogenothermaceae bacterium]
MKVVRSPAKVNIGLWITEKRADGYHNIFSFFHTVDFYDVIYIKPSSRLTVKTSLHDPALEDEKNIVYKAVVEFENFTGFYEDFEILIEKNIPLGSGLGGGSSNAATVIKFLNEYFSYPLSEEDLIKLSVKVGADVPFFLKGGFALVEGIGDKITHFDRKYSEDLFIVYPNVHSHTKLIYSKVTQDLLTEKDQLNIIFNLQKEYGLNKLLEVAQNSLGEIARREYPQIDEVVRFLEEKGYKAFISGSGSSVYCFGKPSEKVKVACKVRDWKLIETKLT